MRWVVKVSPMGGSGEAQERVVQAGSWREALQKVRGSAPLGGGVAVELVPGGCRVTDPARRARYSVTCDEPVPASAPPPPPPASAPEWDDTGASDGSEAAGFAPPRTPEHWLVLERAEQPTPQSPITYRERAYAVAPGTPLDEVELLLWVRFKDLCDELAGSPPGKYVQLAVFDHTFEVRPQRPPLATLAWKDWRGDPVLHFPLTRPLSLPPPGPVSMPPPGFTAQAPTRRSSDDLLSDLFDALAPLPQQADSAAGAALVHRVVSAALPCAGVLVHFFDLNTNEYVVIRAGGPKAAAVESLRTRQKEPPFGALVRQDGARCIDAAFDGNYVAARRWELLGVRPHFALCGLIVRERRLLGAVELVNPVDGAPFTEAEAKAIDYVCERLGEFLEQRPLEFGAIVISDG